MSLPLEQIIRPFQTAFPQNRDRVIASTVKQPPEIAQLQWGAAGQLPTATEENPPYLNFKVNDPSNDQSLTEKSRTTQTVRVQNPDDPDQFVDVQRIQQIVFKAPKTAQPESQYTSYSTTATAVSGGSTDLGGGLSSTPGSQPGETDYTYSLNWPTS